MGKVALTEVVDPLADPTGFETAYNNNLLAIQTAMDLTLSRDGTSPNTFSGAALDMGNNQIVNGSASDTPPPVDPVAAQVLVLLHFNGIHGSRTVIDEKGHTVTCTPSTPELGCYLDTNRFKFGTAAFNCATGGTLSVSMGADFNRFNMGTQDWTIEFWLYIDNANQPISNSTLCYMYNGLGNIPFSVYLDNSGTNRSVVLYTRDAANGIAGTFDTTTPTVPVDQWVHFAFTRQGSAIRGFQNGQLIATVSYAGPIGLNMTAAGSIGLMTGGPQDFTKCSMDDFRYTLGTARYTADFPVPTQEFT